MKGPYASHDNIDNPQQSDYSIGKVGFYAAFDWSYSEDAQNVVRNLAYKHSIGFFDVSADGGEYCSLVNVADP